MKIAKLEMVYNAVRSVPVQDGHLGAPRMSPVVGFYSFHEFSKSFLIVEANPA